MVAARGRQHDPAEHLTGCHLLVGNRGLRQGQYLVYHAAQFSSARGSE
jgi:hypothetical protein